MPGSTSQKPLPYVFATNNHQFRGTGPEANNRTTVAIAILQMSNLPCMYEISLLFYSSSYISPGSGRQIYRVGHVCLA